MDDFTGLQKEIARLTGEVAKLHQENKQHRIRRKKAVEELGSLKVEHETATKELGKLRDVAKTPPDEWQSKYETLKGEVVGARHKSAFGKVAKDLKVRDDAVDDLWQISKYAPGTDEPDEAAIKLALEPLVKAKPYLVASEASEVVQESAKVAPALQPGPGVSRAKLTDPVGAIRTVTKAELRDYSFMQKYGQQVGKGLNDGSIQIDG